MQGCDRQRRRVSEQHSCCRPAPGSCSGDALRARATNTSSSHRQLVYLIEGIGPCCRCRHEWRRPPQAHSNGRDTVRWRAHTSAAQGARTARHQPSAQRGTKNMAHHREPLEAFAGICRRSNLAGSSADARTNCLLIRQKLEVALRFLCARQSRSVPLLRNRDSGVRTRVTGQ